MDRLRGPLDALDELEATRPRNVRQLKLEYKDKGLDQEPDTFVLYRIIGNDLYPRHRLGQSRDNVRFILENEQPLPQCQKRWVVNRIVDRDEEAAIIALLEEHGQPYLHIPFDLAHYGSIDWDHERLPGLAALDDPAFEGMRPDMQGRLRAALHRHKTLYAMNNNGARNVALNDGRQYAKWVLPWDGNCFLTPSAWDAIRKAVLWRPYLKYFLVPMQRVTDNASLISNDFPNVRPTEEPQILFRRDALEQFDERFPYGRRPKVELFWRLGVPGPWNRWGDDPWDLPRPKLSKEAGSYGVAGWVARLNSGAAHLEEHNKANTRMRRRVREEAILTTLERLDGLAKANRSTTEQ